MRLTAREMCDKGLTPLDVYDANGMRIARRITSFDTETGEVTSCVCRTDGTIIFGEDCAETRKEKFPAPLTWHTISREDMKRADDELWDRQGK